MDNEQKCPFSAQAHSGRSNRDWWPNQLNLNALHAHHPVLVVKAAGVRKAKCYELRSAVVGADGAAGAWQANGFFTNSRSMLVSFAVRRR